MGLTDAVNSCFSKYLTFSGRAPRSEYWWFWVFQCLCYMIVAIIFCVIGYAVGGFEGMYIAEIVGCCLSGLLMICPAISVTVRRLHDTGHSGFWYFITYLPFIGSFWFLYLMLKGSDDENEYGLPIY